MLSSQSLYLSNFNLLLKAIRQLSSWSSWNGTVLTYWTLNHKNRHHGVISEWLLFSTNNLELPPEHGDRKTSYQVGMGVYTYIQPGPWRLVRHGNVCLQPSTWRLVSGTRNPRVQGQSKLNPASKHTKNQQGNRMGVLRLAPCVRPSPNSGRKTLKPRSWNIKVYSPWVGSWGERTFLPQVSLPEVIPSPSLLLQLCLSGEPRDEPPLTAHCTMGKRALISSPACSSNPGGQAH